MFEEKKLNSLFAVPDGYIITDALFLTYSLNLMSLNNILIQCGITDTYNTSKENLRDFPNHVTCVMKNDRAIKDINQHNAFYANLLNQGNNQRIFTIKGNTFHPKLYAMLYTNKEDTEQNMVRLIISSRNITQANYYEAAICLDGIPRDNELEQNKELSNLIKDCSGEKKDVQIKNWSDIIERTDFSDSIRKFVGKDAKYEFVTSNPSQNTKINIDFNRFKKMVIISPFLGKWEYISKIVENKEEWKIITRKEIQKDNLPNDASEEIQEHFQYLNIMSDPKNEDSVVSLHAKVYAMSSDDSNELYLGSSNFSVNGFENNYELMIKITSPSTKFVDLINNQVKDNLVRCQISEEAEEVDIEAGTFKPSKESVDEIITKIMKPVEVEELGKLGVHLFDCSIDGEFFIDEFISRCVNMDTDSLKSIIQKAMEYKNSPHNPVVDRYLVEIIGR